MLCSCQIDEAKPHKIPRPTLRPDPKTRLRLAGTFDFRWPLDTKIRLAFQEGDAETLKEGIELVKQAFEAWGVSTRLEAGGPALTYAIVDKHLPAGGAVPDSLVKEEQERVNQLIKRRPHAVNVDQLQGDTNRFAARASEPGARMAMPHEKAADADALVEFQSMTFQYDVLISFTAMPIVIPGNEYLENAPRVLVYAESDLGAYATREDLGLPTAFLGRPCSFKVPPGAANADLAWLRSREGRFTILHEVGHILGLPHEHQNPNRGLEWRPNDEIRALLQSRRQEPVYENFLPRDLTKPFAQLEGAHPFSQWREVTDAEKAGGLIASVMVEPIYRCLLKHREPKHDCLREAVCEFEQRAYEELARPTPSDLEHLKRLYPSIEERKRA